MRRRRQPNGERRRRSSRVWRGHAKLGRIVERFVEQLPGKLAQMDDAAQRRDMAELAALAHWLKGAGGSMGFDDLFEPAKALGGGRQAGDAGRRGFDIAHSCTASKPASCAAHRHPVTEVAEAGA